MAISETIRQLQGAEAEAGATIDAAHVAAAAAVAAARRDADAILEAVPADAREDLARLRETWAAAEAAEAAAIHDAEATEVAAVRGAAAAARRAAVHWVRDAILGLAAGER